MIRKINEFMTKYDQFKNTSLSPLNKDISIEYLRAIACLFVLIIHISSVFIIEPGRELHRVFFTGINSFASSAVALFLFISGFSLTLRYHNVPLCYGTFLKKRFCRVGLPFLCWSLFYFLGNFASLQPLALDSITGFFWGFSHYHLYYLVIILQFYFVFPLFLKLHQRFPFWWLPLLFFVIGCWCERQSIYFGSWRITDRVLPTYGGYLSLGVLAALHREKWKAWLQRWHSWLFVLWGIVGLLGAAQFYFLTFNFQGPLLLFSGYRYLVYAIVSILFGSAVTNTWAQCQTFPPFLQRVVVVFCSLSLDIYLIHPFFLNLFANFLNKFSLGSFLRFGLLFLLVFAASVIFALLKAGISRKMFNKDARHKKTAAKQNRDIAS